MAQIDELISGIEEEAEAIGAAGVVHSAARIKELTSQIRDLVNISVRHPIREPESVDKTSAALTLDGE